MCVNDGDGGGDDVAGGRSGRESGSLHHPLPPSLPWSETTAAGTSPEERWG